MKIKITIDLNEHERRALAHEYGRNEPMTYQDARDALHLAIHARIAKSVDEYNWAHGDARVEAGQTCRSCGWVKPRRGPGAAPRTPRDVSCPTCQAGPGEPCTSMAKRYEHSTPRTPSGVSKVWLKRPHPERVAALEAARFPNPITPDML